MKDRIIDEAIQLLKKQGLKFNVNDIATNLKISKKTIYKYYSSKDELALAMYKKLFEEFNERIKKEEIFENKMIILYNAIMFLKDDIFNRFSLNEQIYFYANNQIDILWENVSTNLNIINNNINISILKKIVFSSLPLIEYNQIDEYCNILKRGIL